MTHIVIPIGVSQPGTPVLKYLEKSIDSIQNQSSKNYLLTVAADDNISEECKNLLIKKNVNVKWFEPASFFRKGGIWKKICETWKTSDTKYLAFLHYDDFWDSLKLEKQVKQMEENNLSSSWAQSFVIDENDFIISGDCSSINEFSKQTIGYRTLALAHAMIVKRTDFFKENGITMFENTWAPVFEDIFVIYAHLWGKGQKVNGAGFFWRNHSMNMTNSIISGKQEYSKLLAEQRIIANYSNEEVDIDAKMMNEKIQELVNNYKNE